MNYCCCRWAEKQSQSFTAWLNFALHPKADWSAETSVYTAAAAGTNIHATTAAAAEHSGLTSDAESK